MGIKETDLKIKNAVYYNGSHNHIGIVTSLQPQFDRGQFSATLKCGINNRFDILYDFKDLKPILLAEEILRDRCGMSSYKGWDDQFFWCLPDEYGNLDRFELFETDNGYELPSGAICKYLHQLQNCYYFHYLSGKELEITI